MLEEQDQEIRDLENENPSEDGSNKIAELSLDELAEVIERVRKTDNPEIQAGMFAFQILTDVLGSTRLEGVLLSEGIKLTHNPDMPEEHWRI